jgi:hypothetical protein
LWIGAQAGMPVLLKQKEKAGDVRKTDWKFEI